MSTGDFARHVLMAAALLKLCALGNYLVAGMLGAGWALVVLGDWLEKRSVK